MTGPFATDWIQLLLTPIWTGVVLVIALVIIWVGRAPLRRFATELGVSRISLFGIDLEWIADATAEAYRERGLDVPSRRQLQPVVDLGTHLAPLVRGRRVLWVDDNPGWVEAETRVFRTFGVDVENAVTTEEAMRRLEKSPGRFDLVISDWTRDGTEAGPELLEQLQALGAPRLPLAFYTADASPQRRARAAALGAVALTTLPDELIKYALVELATHA